MGLVIGIDLGGTETKIGLVDEHGKILNKTTIPTLVSRGREDVVARIANSIHNILDIANEKDKVLAMRNWFPWINRPEIAERSYFHRISGLE